MKRKITAGKKFTILFLISISLFFAGCNEKKESILSEEIEMFNNNFFNGETYNMNNMLLSSEYTKPEEINLAQLFYDGIGGASDAVSEEEMDRLMELNSEAEFLDVVKITSKQMDDLLKEKLGIGLEETEKNGMENFLYLEEYDSYYLIKSDTNYDYCTVISGEWETKNQLRLEYEKEFEGGKWEVVLEKENDRYRFVSNQKLN